MSNYHLREETDLGGCACFTITAVFVVGLVGVGLVGVGLFAVKAAVWLWGAL